MMTVIMRVLSQAGIFHGLKMDRIQPGIIVGHITKELGQCKL